MRHFAKPLLLLCAVMLTACGSALDYRKGSARTLAGRVEAFVGAVQERHAQYTDEQWERAAETFRSYKQEVAARYGELTQEDKKRIAKAAGVYTGIVAANAAGQINALINDATQMLPEFEQGLREVIGETE